MYARHCRHYGELNKNIHNNKHLQSSWNKYGEEMFEFNVVEYCDTDILNEREQYWIEYFDTTNNENGYNIRIDPFTNRGLKWSDEQREKMYQRINEEGSWFKNHMIPQSTMEKAWEAVRHRVWTKEERKRQSDRLRGTKVRDTSNMKKAQTGEGNGCHKLSENEVIEIINLLNYGYKVADLAAAYNVSHSNISTIKSQRSWKHLDRKAILASENLERGLSRINEYNKSNQDQIKYA